MSSWTRLLQENVWGRCSELDRDMPKEVWCIPFFIFTS
jgi:hypothetical protein